MQRTGKRLNDTSHSGFLNRIELDGKLSGIRSLFFANPVDYQKEARITLADGSELAD